MMFVWSLILMDCCLIVGCLLMIIALAMRERQQRRSLRARHRGVRNG
jgi:uncharacterized integral membrane protein